MITHKCRFIFRLCSIALFTSVLLSSLGGRGSTVRANQAWTATPTPARTDDSAYIYAVFDHPLDQPQSYFEVGSPALFSGLQPSIAPYLTDSSGTTAYTELDTLFVIYTNTAAGTINATDVIRVKENASETAEFIWRQSHFKFLLNLSFLVINDYKDTTEFTQHPNGGYWLNPTDDDGDGVSVESDLIVRGVVANQFDSINYLWAHNNGGIPVAYGGLGGLIYWKLGTTGITENPIFQSSGSESFSTAFPHEIQHTVDAMMDSSGYPDYFFADRPWDYPGPFGENWSFWEYQMKHWPINNWLVLHSPWGDIVQVTDVDDDGVPDTGASLPITEQSLGSSTMHPNSDSDTFFDLDEATAGLFRNTNLINPDTDGDGALDGNDPEPLYPTKTQILKKTMILNGNPVGWDMLTSDLNASNSPFASDVYSDWDANNLYLMIRVDRYAGIRLMIDANADGWFHGKDNYEITIDPSYTNPTNPLIIDRAHIWDSSDATIASTAYPRWDDDANYPFGQLVTDSDIGRYARSDGNGFLVQIAIPYNVLTGLTPQPGKHLGFNVTYTYVDRQSNLWSETFEKDDFAYFILHDPAIKGATFSDVPTSHPYFSDIEILYANGLTGGCQTSPLKFCPDQTMDRGQTAVFMLRGNFGSGFVPDPTKHIFKDDWKKGTWAEPWAEAMYYKGLSAGCLTSPLKYCPWDQIPREQAVIFALRLKYGNNYTPPPATGTMFADLTDPKYYATSWAEQAYQDGLIPNCGTSGGKPKICPKALVSRGLGAYMIVRAKNLSMR
jgi:hypothetical protein